MGATYTKDTPCPRVFYCRLCGERVYVDSRMDRRTVFCCERHEKNYWKHSGRYLNASDERNE